MAAAFDFPPSPATGTSYAGYVWDGQKWNIAPVAVTNSPASSANPKLWGVATPGAALPYSREDHVHPADEVALAYSGMQINGSMEVSQENGSTLITLVNGAAYKYITDGWQAAFGNAAGVLKAQQVGVNVTAAPFFNALAITSTTAIPSVGPGDYVQLTQFIEGWRVARLGWGTSNAQPITIGFWIWSTIAGHSSVVAYGSSPNRSYIVDYTINNPSVWEYKTITIPGDTVGTAWKRDNTTGLALSWVTAAGTTYQGTGGVWNAGLLLGTAAQTNLYATNGNIVYLTGVVVLPGLEAPSAARSPLIMRPFDQELLTCQRYWQKNYPVGSNPGASFSATAGGEVWGSSNGAFTVTSRFPTRMRSSPSIKTWDHGGNANFVGYFTTAWNTGGAVGFLNPSDISFFLGSTISGASQINFYWTADARL